MARRQEKEGARLTGSTLQPASGALWPPSLKADYVNETYLTEQKTTMSRMRQIAWWEWDRIAEQAERLGKLPRLVVCFVPAPGIEYWWSITGKGRMYPHSFWLYAEENKTHRSIASAELVIEQLLNT